MNKKNQYLPKLRFPEFATEGGWEIMTLGEIARLVTEKAGSKKYTLLSITSGVGLVSQVEKFGKEIAGEAYKNYYVIKREDFAYNKSSTKFYPEGQISMLETFDEGAIPNSIFTCFRGNKDIVYPYFLKYLFDNNIHGVWLRKFISVGARAHGALQVDTKDLFLLPILLPSLAEQEKIASCLSSLDEWIAAQSDKVATLKTYKKGLMQQLFPAQGETVPKLRFKEFQDCGEWEVELFEDIASFVDYRGKTPTKTEQGVLLLTAKNVKFGYIDYNISQEYVNLAEYNDIMKRGLPKIGDILFTTEAPLGNVAQIDREDIALAQRIIKLRAKIGNSTFLKYLMIADQFQYLIHHKSIGSTVIGIQSKVLKKIKILMPKVAEQEKIASCLSAIDERIAAEAEKLTALKNHKKGLMQQLFPNATEQ